MRLPRQRLDNLVNGRSLCPSQHGDQLRLFAAVAGTRCFRLLRPRRLRTRFGFDFDLGWRTVSRIRLTVFTLIARIDTERRESGLKPKEEIGAEVHKLDQFFRVEEGTGEAVLDGVRTTIRAGFAVVVPAGANHNIINTGSVQLKLYTLYAPPNHRDGVVHHTRDDAEADDEHFEGKMTE